MPPYVVLFFHSTLMRYAQTNFVQRLRRSSCCGTGDRGVINYTGCYSLPTHSHRQYWCKLIVQRLKSMMVLETFFVFFNEVKLHSLEERRADRHTSQSTWHQLLTSLASTVGGWCARGSHQQMRLLSETIEGGSTSATLLLLLRQLLPQPWTYARSYE